MPSLTPKDLSIRFRALMASGNFGEVIRIAASTPGVLDEDDSAFCLALAYIQLGNAGAAAPILRTLVAHSPHRFDIKAALCKLLIIEGREFEASEALGALESDARRHPGAAHSLGEVYLQAKRITDAHRVFSMLKQSTGHVAADIGLSETFLRMGHTDAAIASARHAWASLGMQPAVLQVVGPAALCSGDQELLATCLQELGKMPSSQAITMLDLWVDMLLAAARLPEACFVCQRLVDIEASPARLRLLAELKLSNRDLTGALEAAERASELNPEDAKTMTVLARCRLAEGNIETATRWLRDALVVAPNCIDAYDQLSQIDPAGIDQGMYDQITKLLNNANAVSANDRPKLGLAMGRIAEARGDHEVAFRHYSAAKQQIAREANAAGRGYNPSATETGLRRLISAFQKVPRASRQKSLGSVSPIFIVGMPRSGTSLIEQVLSSHPEVFGAGELPAMVENLGALIALLEGGADVDATIRDNRQAWIERYESRLLNTGGTVHMTDKHPLNFWSVGLIAALYPGSPIIHVMRDPLDTCLSVFKQRFHSDYTFANDLDDLAHFYTAYERMMMHWRSIFPALIEVKYESFVSEFEISARKLVAACDLPWADACLDFHQSKRAVFTHSAAQVRAPVKAGAVDRWRKFGQSLGQLQETLVRYRAHWANSI